MMKRNIPASEEVLVLAEEELHIGKRLVHGTAGRIRRFPAGPPCGAGMTLHEEHVRILQRALADPDSLRNIEWPEPSVIQREGIDRVVTVRGTVRRQHVVIERIEEK